MKVLPVNRERVFGIETEYGVHPVPGDVNIAQSQVNEALPDYLHGSTEGFNEYGRIYPDQSKNIEVCTPELITLEGLLASHFAGEELAQEVVEGIFGVDAFAQKRTLDTNMASRGEHDNFLVGTDFGYEDQIKLAAHLATRIVLTGPGVVYQPLFGAAFEYALDPRALVTQSSDIVGDSSDFSGRGGDKPFIRTLFDSDAFDDSNNSQRLQIVCSSPNMYPYPVAARIFNTSSIIRLIEHGKYPEYLQLADPYRAIKDISNDLTLRAKVELQNGKHWTAGQIQAQLLETALQLDLPPVEHKMATQSAEILADLLRGKADKWSGYLEWCDKMKLLRAHADKYGYDFPNVTSAATDIKWHELRSDIESLSSRLRRLGKVAMLPDTDAKAAAKQFAPDATRGRVRAQAIRTAASQGMTLHSVDWHIWQRDDSYTPTRVDNAYTRRTKRPRVKR